MERSNDGRTVCYVIIQMKGKLSGGCYLTSSLLWLSNCLIIFLMFQTKTFEL